MKIEILEPIGFCKGVERSISIALKTKENYKKKKIVILGELIHNKETNDLLKENEINILNIIPSKDTILSMISNYDIKETIFIFSAHGHDIEINKIFDKNNIQYIDGTCPIISKINSNLSKKDFQNYNVYYFGKKDHIECISSLTFIKKYRKLILIDKNCDLSTINFENHDSIIINQSTISLNPLKKIISKLPYKEKFLYIDNFCPALKLRFDQIAKNINNYDLFLIIGDKNSSNANELVNYVKFLNKSAFLISNIDDLKNLILNKNIKKVAILSATSTSKNKVNKCIEILNKCW